MKDEAIKSELLAALDIVAMERLAEGEFELIGAAPRWLAQFLPEAVAEGDRVRRVFGGEDVFGARRSGWWVASG